MSWAAAGDSLLWFISSTWSIFYDFFFFSFPLPSCSPPAVRLRRFISSLFAVLSGNNKFKIMTAVRVDAGVVRKQEKGSFVISDSVSAIQCQRNTHDTYAVLRTMSPRHQSGEWKGESEGGGGRGTEKQLRKTDWEKTQRHKDQNYLLSWKCMVSLEPVIYTVSPQSSWPLPVHPSVHSQQMNRWRCYLYSQNKSCQNRIYSCSSTLTFSKAFL